MKRILLLSGKQGAGKTSNGERIMALCRDLGYKPQRMSFAGILYELHNACLPILQANGIRPSEMQKDGELLQVLGTEFGRRHLGETVWVDALRRKVDRELADDPRGEKLIVIDDARFENEFDGFPDAFRVRMECAREVRKARASYWRENDSHPSETGLDLYAMADRFDLYVATSRQPPDVTAHTIRVSWFEE